MDYFDCSSENQEQFHVLLLLKRFVIFIIIGSRYIVSWVGRTGMEQEINNYLIIDTSVTDRIGQRSTGIWDKSVVDNIKKVKDQRQQDKTGQRSTVYKNARYF